MKNDNDMQLSQSDFWLALLEGELSKEETEEYIKRFHLKEATPVVVFLLCFPKGFSDEAGAILSDIIGEGHRILESDSLHRILLILPREAVSPERIKEKAHMLSDTLSAEGMLPVLVSYEGCVNSISELSASYNKVKTAEECGRAFSPEKRVFSYHELGIARFIGKLEREECIEYLNDHLGDFRFSSMDSELFATIHAFFEEGLSIANTARRLYVHRNTLVYRLDKFESLCGLDLRRFEDAMTAEIAMIIEAHLK